jgi:hypothetical protein
MQWTCQADGPLWWGIQHSEKWYRSDTSPPDLVADYLRAHPQDHGKTLILIWWKNWQTIGAKLQIEHQQESVLLHQRDVPHLL